MRHDLNSIVTVKGLANYYIGLTEKCLEDKDDNPWSNAECPGGKWPINWMETLGPVLSNDSSPTFALIHLLKSCSSPRWDNLPSGHQRYPLKGLNLGYMYWGQKHFSE